MSSPSSSRTVAVRAPTRIDLGGGWTDVPPYAEEQGGFVCNVAITRYATATVRAAETYRGDPAAAAQAGAAMLISAATRRAGLEGIHVGLHNDFPVSAGLGGSSAASAAILGALRRWNGLEWDRTGIAEEGRRIEVEDLGVAGGRQDHYAAVYGGLLGLTFAERVGVRHLEVSPATVAEFTRRGLLVYTGESRVSGSTVRAVMDAYRDRDEVVREALAAMKALARQMASALEAGDLDGLGALLAEHWSFQRSLDPSIPTERIDEIVMRAHAAGAAGWKAMGASGGGCVFVLSGNDVEPVRRAIAPLGEVVPFDVDRDGLADVSPSG